MGVRGFLLLVPMTREIVRKEFIVVQRHSYTVASNPTQRCWSREVWSVTAVRPAHLISKDDGCVGNYNRVTLG